MRQNVAAEIARAQRGAEALIRAGHTDFSMTGDATATEAYPETENWQKAIGAYQQWSSADVSVDGNTVTMNITVHAEDYYNFNRDQSDIATGASDNENGRFTELGWVKPFESSGTITRTVTWELGHPDSPDISDESDPERDPGREDREDERDSGDPDRPAWPDNNRDTEDSAADDRRRSPGSAAHRLLAGCAAVVVSVGVFGCGPDQPAADERSDRVSDDRTPAKAEKTGTGESRHDLEPLIKRFDALGSPTKATWMSGTLGDSDVPGPASYWIDAIVTLDRGRAESLADRYAATKASETPDVVDGLREKLPDGPLMSGERLDDAFSQGGFSAHAYLDVSSDRLVLTAKGQ